MSVADIVKSERIVGFITVGGTSDCMWAASTRNFVGRSSLFHSSRHLVYWLHFCGTVEWESSFHGRFSRHPFPCFLENALSALLFYLFFSVSRSFLRILKCYKNCTANCRLRRLRKYLQVQHGIGMRPVHKSPVDH